MAEVLQIRDLRFGWSRHKPLLAIDELALQAGECVLLRGPSGSGKSTLLGLLGGVLLPDAGEIRIAGQALNQLPARQRDRYRAEHIGIIFQMFNLLPYLDVLSNVLLPLQFAPLRRARAGAGTTDRRLQAERLLAQLGLAAEHWQQAATELSIGQQQRVAAARALLGAPELILADEPTSALDSSNRDRFLEVLLTQARSTGSAVLLVSHDDSLAPHFDRQLDMAALRADADAATEATPC